ncbi:uncharacterized protein K444DRAFT_522479, partial [Hyaloscypha bicolor E]
RKRIKGTCITGISPHKIELLIKYLYSTIRSILALETLYTNSFSISRKGRSFLYSNRNY